MSDESGGEGLDVERLIEVMHLVRHKHPLMDSLVSEAHAIAREYAALSAPSPEDPKPDGLTADRLAAAINDAQVTPAELQLGRDLTVPAVRILAALDKTRP